MTMNRETLKRYAEFGVRERLREMQRELETLARDFPHLVRNADGSLPSVLPLVAKARAQAAAKKHAIPHARTLPTPAGRRHPEIAARIDAVRRYLHAHPHGATRAELLAVAGYHTENGAFNDRILRKIARETRTGTAPARWHLKTAPSNGHGASNGTAPKTKKHGRTAKIKRQRAISAALLAKYDPETPRTVGGSGLGSLVRRGYLVKTDAGYLRTAKPFEI
jgi:hypothetical protein